MIPLAEPSAVCVLHQGHITWQGSRLSRPLPPLDPAPEGFPKL
jgi:hypothetical protein